MYQASLGWSGMFLFPLRGQMVLTEMQHTHNLLATA